ncbi:MAG: hypothetical protein HY270_14005 [Deltaproteobacteria bacterium]|nr:hypothetical protein [Deltaproteobacteria bacterium]
MTEATDRHSVLEAHAGECAECRNDAAALDRIGRLLQSSVVRVDVAALSQHTMTLLRPELSRRARSLLVRRVLTATLLALLPLPLVLIYDAYLLDAFYQIARLLLPAAIATYLVATYVAFLGLLFGGTYAAIPLLVARRATAAAASGE